MLLPPMHFSNIVDFDNILKFFSCFHKKFVLVRAENFYHIINFLLQPSINVSDNSITIVLQS